MTRASTSNNSVVLRVDSANVLVVEIGEGYDMNPPQSFEIALQGPALAVTGVETGALTVTATAMILAGAMLVTRARRFEAER